MDAWRFQLTAHPSELTKVISRFIDGQKAGLSVRDVQSLPSVLFSTENALIVKDKALIIFNEKTVLGQSIEGYKNGISSINISYKKEINFDREVMALGTVYNKNYSHWITQILPSAVIYAENFCSRPLFISPLLSEWQRDALNLFVKDYDVYEKAPGEIVRARRVYGSSLNFHLMHSTILSPGALRQLRTRVPAFQSGARRRVCISRLDARARKLRNAEQVYSIMREFGFEVLTLAGMKLQEQIALMQEADIIAGEHGAGLTNVLFSRARQLIEFMPKGAGSGAFPLLAQMCGVPTLRVYGSKFARDVPGGSWEIDPVVLRDALAGLDI